MATTTLKAGMVWKGAYDASVTYDKLDVVCNADKTQIAVCKQGGSGIPLTNSNYWEVSIDASGIIALLEDALAHGEIYTMKIGSVTTGATSSATIVNNHQTHETILNLVLEKGEKGDKGDKGDRGEKGDTTVIDPSTATAYTLYNQTGNHTDGAMTQAAVTEEFEKLDEVYARNDGYYESMGVGTATNLKGQNTVDAEFAYRKSGGNVEVQDGNAMIEAIKGNTVAWNQLIRNGDFSASTLVWQSGGYAPDIAISNGELVATATRTSGIWIRHSISFPAVHKLFFKVKARSDSSVNVIVRLRYTDDTDTDANIISELTSAKTGSAIISMTNKVSNSIDIYTTTVVEIGSKVYFDYIELFDLTLIYGAGNEPSTPEQFEQDYFNWFGKPLTYEPYDAGSLRNTKVSALKTTGFNQWDEEWENGIWDLTTGNKSNDNSFFRSKNYIAVLPETSYHFYRPSSYSTIGAILFYDANKTYLGQSLAIQLTTASRTFITPANCRFITFRAYGTTYNNDICINISDPNRNGEYEPYKESTLPLDVTTLTGKLNGEGNSVVVFPNGMEQGDKITIADGVVKAIRRRKVVDMESLTWSHPTNTNFFYTTLPNYYYATDGQHSAFVAPLISGKYPTKSQASRVDKSISGYNMSTNSIMVTDSAYTTAAEFKAAMSGVELCYELTEPEVYVLDDFSLPKLYPVANGGTEEQLSNSPNSLPATLSIRYGLNAAAFIQNAPKNYISKESMSNFLSNLGSAMGGTWSMVWNSSTNKYDFSFTQNRSVDVKQPIEDK